MTVTKLLSTLVLSVTLAAQGDVNEQIRRLHREKDDADIVLIEKIGRTQSRDAAVGLIEGYDKCVTLLFRREIVKTLARFANLPACEQPVLDKLAEIAGSSSEEELRVLSLRGLGQSTSIGKQLLQRIIDSKASDELRVPAMLEHVKIANAGDAAWYRKIWNLENKQRKDENGDILPPEHNQIRQLAFQGAQRFLSQQELVQTLKREVDPKIRRSALEWMDREKMSKAIAMAEMVLGRVTFRGGERAVAARMLADAKGSKVLAEFVKLAKKRDVTQEDLRREMARLITTFGDPKSKQRVAKMIGKGKPHEKIFALLASAKNNDPKVLVAVRKCLKDRSIQVRRVAGEVIGLRRDKSSLPALRQLLSKPKELEDVRIALEAIDQIEGPVSSWLKELAGYAVSEDLDVRNAAISILGAARDKRHLPVLLTALKHSDWSTRLLAVQALAALRDGSAVAHLIERMAMESGRMKKEVAQALWLLTAQPFDEDEDKWADWWRVAKNDFKVATADELEEAEKARERRRLTQRTVSKAKFFGIKVESHRVIFVLDVSGSMMESMYGRKIEGRGAARIDIAKQELAQAVDNLDPGALFNILTFSTGVARWLKAGIGANSESSRTDAKDWIGRLGASGGTNLYDSVREALRDQDVDTIFILSDGEPTTGEVIDPYRIREDVVRWNKHRKVMIHTIAIGGNLEILQWLAEDAGGKYRQMR